MALALCLLFDSRTDRLVRELWERLEARGIRTLLSHTHGVTIPHLSYAVLREWDLRRRPRAPWRSCPPMVRIDIAVQGSLVFPRGRVSLACSVSSDLATRQERAVTALTSTRADLHRHYAAGRWVPHVSVATGASAEQLPVITAAVSDVLPLTLHADRARPSSTVAPATSGRSTALPEPRPADACPLNLQSSGSRVATHSPTMLTAATTPHSTSEPVQR